MPEPLFRRTLADNRLIDVVPLTYGRARLHIGAADASWYDDAWDYDDPATATLVAATWDGDGDPPGFTRHPASGRRRPAGDPAREYIHR